PTFDEAMNSIFGDLAQPTSAQQAEKPKEASTEVNTQTGASPGASPTPPVGGSSVQQLLDKAVREFDDYQRLTSQGKLGEAGQKLEQHKRTLDELKRALQQKPYARSDSLDAQ